PQTRNPKELGGCNIELDLEDRGGPSQELDDCGGVVSGKLGLGPCEVPVRSLLPHGIIRDQVDQLIECDLIHIDAEPLDLGLKGVVIKALEETASLLPLDRLTDVTWTEPSHGDQSSPPPTAAVLVVAGEHHRPIDDSAQPLDPIPVGRNQPAA